MRTMWFAIFAGAVFLAAGAQAAASVTTQIQIALSAAPPAIAAHASVIVHDMKGVAIVLRKGSNGWTCIPPSPAGPDTDPEPKPACFDANGLAFMDAFAAGHAPNQDKPGYSYMLQGGSGWSNTDPAATNLPPGRRDYIHIPPHVMVLSAKMANESGLPLHESDPDTHTPFVMFGGTPFALIIIPVR